MSYNIPLRCLDLTLNYTNNPTISSYNAEIIKNVNNFRPVFIIKNELLSVENLSNIIWWQDRKLIKISIDHLNNISNGQVQQIIAQYNPITYKSGYTTFNIVMLKINETNSHFKPISENFNINTNSFSSQQGIISSNFQNNIQIKIYCGRNSLNDLFDPIESNNSIHNFYNMIYLKNKYLLLGEKKIYTDYFYFAPLLYPLSTVTTNIKTSQPNIENFLDINNLPLIINTNDITEKFLLLKTITGKKNIELKLIFESADPLFNTFDPELLTINNQIINIPLEDNTNTSMDPNDYKINLDLFQIIAKDTVFSLSDINLIKLKKVDISFSLVPADISSNIFKTIADVDGNIYITNFFTVNINSNSFNIFDIVPSSFTYPSITSNGKLLSFETISKITSINSITSNEVRKITFSINSNDSLFKDLFINDININICSVEILNKNTNQLSNKIFINSLNSNSSTNLKVVLTGSDILNSEPNDLKLLTNESILEPSDKYFKYKLSLLNETFNASQHLDNKPWDFMDSYNVYNPIHNFKRLQLTDITNSFSNQTITSGTGFKLIEPYTSIPASGSWTTANDISLNGVFNGYFTNEETVDLTSEETMDMLINYSDIVSNTVLIPWKNNLPDNSYVNINLSEQNVSPFDFFKLNNKDSSFISKKNAILNNSGISFNVNSPQYWDQGITLNDYAQLYKSLSENNIIYEKLLNFDINNNPFLSWDLDISFNVMSNTVIRLDTSDPSLKNKEVIVKLFINPYIYSSTFNENEIFIEKNYITRSSELPGFSNSYIEINFKKIDSNVNHLILYISDLTPPKDKNRSVPTFKDNTVRDKKDLLDNFYYNQTYTIFNIIKVSDISIGTSTINSITSNNYENDGLINFNSNLKEGISNFNFDIDQNIQYSNTLKSILNQTDTSYQINSIKLHVPEDINIKISNGNIVTITWKVDGKNVYDFSNPLIGNYNINSYFNIYRQKGGSDVIELIGSTTNNTFVDNTANSFTNYNYYIEGIAEWEGFSLNSGRSTKKDGFVFVCENNSFPSGRWNNTRENKKLYRQLSTNCEVVNQSSSTPRVSGNLFPNSLNLTKKGIYKFLSDGTRRPNR